VNLCEQVCWSVVDEAKGPRVEKNGHGVAEDDILLDGALVVTPLGRVACELW